MGYFDWRFVWSTCSESVDFKWDFRDGLVEVIGLSFAALEGYDIVLPDTILNMHFPLYLIRHYVSSVVVADL